MLTRSKRKILQNKESNDNQKHKNTKKTSPKNTKNRLLNKIESSYFDENGIIRNFIYDDSKSSNLKRMKKDTRSNYNHYFGKDSLMPIPFVIDIPEGMPCYIRNIEDIVNLTEDQVNIFLKGYACNIDGTLDKKKYELATNLGFPLYVTQETFNYDPLLEDLYCARHVKPWTDENGIIRNFSYCGSTTAYVLSVVERNASLNRRFYNKKQLLSPIPFAIDIPEGMPCYIRHIEDIVNLTEDQVNIFLKGYDCKIKGPLNKKKYELAKILGVPFEFAKKSFNYDPSWEKLNFSSTQISGTK
jgi:hypothetical protein